MKNIKTAVKEYSVQKTILRILKVYFQKSLFKDLGIALPDDFDTKPIVLVDINEAKYKNPRIKKRSVYNVGEH